MQIVPVIDLKDGLVVHAVQGNRSAYQPIHSFSSLTRHSALEAVVESFLCVHAFRHFYIADLNAITHTGDHQQQIQKLLQDHPEINFWIDNGSQLSEIKPVLPNQTWVVGTESQHSPLKPSLQNYILSLDFRNEQQMGSADWFDASHYWPEQIIVMTLQRVGSNTGPDIAKLSQLRKRHPDKQFIAAGGVRNRADLINLKNTGINSVLVSTALHSGKISAQTLQNL